MSAREDQRRTAWRNYVEEHSLLLIDALDTIRVNGVRLDSRSKIVLEELMDLLCEPEYMPKQKRDFPEEFLQAVHTATMRLCAECSGNILRCEDVVAQCQKNHKPIP